MVKTWHNVAEADRGGGTNPIVEDRGTPTTNSNQVPPPVTMPLPTDPQGGSKNTTIYSKDIAAAFSYWKSLSSHKYLPFLVNGIIPVFSA